MTALTKNFSLEEFKCNDGTQVPEEYMANVQSLANNLQVLRDEIGMPIHITSGYRSPKYNKRVSKAKSSQHILAKAADVQVEGVAPEEVHTTILRLIAQGKMKQGGVGSYSTFTHYDIRGYGARW